MNNYHNYNKKLYRDEQNKMIGGVCKGLADYFDIDVSIVRAIFLLFLVLKGGGVLIYIILMIVLPKKPIGYFNPGVDYTVPPQADSAQPFAFEPEPKRKNSNVGLIAGLLLIFFGLILTLDEFDVIPNWDFSHLWPVPLVAIGLILIFTSGKKEKQLDPKPPIE
ncbi:PspC domain-containing protein [Mucilaginibacter terrae]|uniref:Phage shock protein C n=1 Tax=Mucilaginibacter terrae TaxID=1955052 RepID=A0ABU3GXW4_9SPHI|nr:PspC domain-containing protein [Mucilaginibacter terrae]MDT3404612.1 phage shock protein C [Mucilaginibacter terrae]